MTWALLINFSLIITGYTESDCRTAAQQVRTGTSLGTPSAICFIVPTTDTLIAAAPK